MKPKVRLLLVLLVVALLPTLMAYNNCNNSQAASYQGITLKPFDSYIEFAEWVNGYQLPEAIEPVFGKVVDCEDYAYYVLMDGISLNKLVSFQIEVWSNTDIDNEYKHMFLAAYIKNERGHVYPRFVDAETKRIYKKAYGLLWRLD